MAPADLYVLHLSDLHISNGIISPVLLGLLKDLPSRLSNVHKLILAVTGDVISAGEYETNRAPAVEFFKRLSGVIPSWCKVVAFEMVPGNHDCVRPTCGNDQNNGLYIPTSSEFESFYEEVCRLFLTDIPADRSWGYGVTDVPYNGRTIRIVRSDTSCYITDDDLREEVKKDIEDSSSATYSVDEVCANRRKALNVKAEVQSGALKRAMEAHWAESERSGSPVVVTIALSHFPLTWLQSDGERIKEILFNRGLDGVDLWLCGHAHRSQLYYNNDDSQTVLMLMTGIGRKEKVSDRQRYSIYRLGIERNSCSVEVLETKDGHTFAPVEILDEYGGRKIYNFSCFPLRQGATGAIIRLNAGLIANAKGFAFDPSTFNLVRAMSLRMALLWECIGREAAQQVGVVLDGLDGVSNRSREEWRALAEENASLESDDRDSNVVGDVMRVVVDTKAFHDLLKLICSAVVDSLSRPVPYEMIVDHDYAEDAAFKLIDWRAHFRKYSCGGTKLLRGGLKDDYYRTCTNSSGGQKMSELPWNHFMKAVYEHPEKSLVFSANDYENPIRTDWDDFMTTVPDIATNKVEYTVLKPVQVRPLLTFGLSLRGKDSKSSELASRLLYILEYLNLNKVVTHGINIFISQIPIVLKKTIMKMEEV